MCAVIFHACRSFTSQTGLPGESTKDGFIPHVGHILDIPYSAAVQKLRNAYERSWVEDLVLSVGGQAFSPNDVEFEFLVAYGAQPVFKTWAGQPAIVMGTLLVMAVVCWCSYGGWGRDRDLQTGYSSADASQDALVRTTRELHEIQLDSGDPAHRSLLGKATSVKSHALDRMDAQGMHFVWTWPCNCRVFKNSRE